MFEVIKNTIGASLLGPLYGLLIPIGQEMTTYRTVGFVLSVVVVIGLFVHFYKEEMSK